jgi:cephalosporin hydroxylase
LQQAILATRLLAKKGIQGSLITVPTKTSLRDIKNLTFQIASRPTLIIENGNKWLGSAQQLYQALFGEGSKVEYLGVQGLPASGTPLEVSQFHQLDPEALSRKILSMLQIA